MDKQDALDVADRCDLRPYPAGRLLPHDRGAALAARPDRHEPARLDGRRDHRSGQAAPPRGRTGNGRVRPAARPGSWGARWRRGAPADNQDGSRGGRRGIRLGDLILRSCKSSIF